jgi:Subtilase family
VSAVLPRRRTGRAPARAPFFTVVLTLLLGCLLTHPRAAGGQTGDAVPTWWHEAAGLTPLLTAPPPPNPATICLIDTGVTATPDLDITARWAYDGGTLDDVRATDDSPGHGTLVAHFAAGAVNGWGGAGAFPHARISSVRVFPREGGAAWQDYIRAISRCAKLDANTKVIVIAIGGQEIAAGEAEELQHYVEQARDLYDDNVVVAAGNGAGDVDFPARIAASFSVAAATARGLCTFAAKGTGVDIAAPGCGLSQADASGDPWSVDGSSFAAPIVAGALAALRSYAPALSAAEAERILVAAARGAPPLLDVTGAFALAGLSSHLGAPSATEHVTPPRTESQERDAAPRPRLPRPRVLARRSRGRVVLVARNRPVGAAFEVRVGRRLLEQRRSRVTFRSRRRAGACRFTAASADSAWTTVRW